MIKNMRRGIPNLFKNGTQHLTGLQEAVLRNIEACKNLTQVTRTSYGPRGMNKMIINHLGKVFVTSDAATIIKEMEVQHPAAKMIVMAAQMQENEIGDGSNFVVVLAGELLAKSEQLIMMGLHPSEILAGYATAGEKVMEWLDDLVVETVEKDQLYDIDVLARGIKSAIAAKQFGYEEQLSKLVAEACLCVMPKNSYNFNVDNVRVVKVLGSGIEDSEVVQGMIIPQRPGGKVSRVKEAQIAVFTCTIGPSETETKGTVLIKNAEDLLNYNQSEEKDIEDTITALKASGVNVVVTNGAVDDMAMHFLDKFGMMVIKVSSKFELRRICRSVKARPIISLGPVAPQDQGYCTEVYSREVGGKRVTVFRQEDAGSTAVATILLRASTNNILNDIERAVDDGVNTVRMMGRDGRFLAGAGAVEIELARRLEEFGNKTAGLEQYAIKQFGEALEVIPRTLAENGGHNATDCVSQLYAAHEKGDATSGVDVVNGGLKDAKNVLDLLVTKKQAVQLVTDAVVTILRVDQIITAKPAGGPKMKHANQGHWDDTD